MQASVNMTQSPGTSNMMSLHFVLDQRGIPSASSFLFTPVSLWHAPPTWWLEALALWSCMLISLSKIVQNMDCVHACQILCNGIDKLDLAKCCSMDLVKRWTLTGGKYQRLLCRCWKGNKGSDKDFGTLRTRDLKRLTTLNDWQLWAIDNFEDNKLHILDWLHDCPYQYRVDHSFERDKLKQPVLRYEIKNVSLGVCGGWPFYM